VHPFIEDPYLADFVGMPSLEGGPGLRLVGGVDDADLFQVHGEGFVFKGKKGLRRGWWWRTPQQNCGYSIKINGTKDNKIFEFTASSAYCSPPAYDA